jgi:hypothetical protein
MNTYLILSFFSFLILGICWNRTSSLNFIIKIFLIGMGVIGAFLYLQSNGYIIKIH